MIFVNKEKFEKFIEENLRVENGWAINMDACFDDFEKKISECGGAEYELSDTETKSGSPETIGFERIDKFFLDSVEVDPGENDFDEAQTIIIF